MLTFMVKLSMLRVNIVINFLICQTFHLRATSEVERQKWVTALELAKAKAIQVGFLSFSEWI